MILYLAALILWQSVEYSNEIQNSLFTCPVKCMCLSQTQIICNNVDLTEIPVNELSPLVEMFTLSKTNVTVIKTEAFSDQKNLRKLLIDGHNIVRVARFAFKGLGKLRELSIQHTSVSRLEKFSFSGLQNLTAILLQHNRIQTIEESSFAGSSNVRLILLHHNPIHVIESGAFSNLRNVEHLIFPSGIKAIESDAFNGLDSVGLIKLPYMDLRCLESYTFRGLTQVHVLSIQESDLGVVKSRAFEGLISVGSLNMINNKIDHLQELKITSENKIRILRLLGNHLLQTPVYGSIDVEVTENFTVVGNHFPCDCRIYAVLESALANNTSYSFVQKNYCISPLEMNGKSISEMSLNRIGRCDNEVSLRSWDSAVSCARSYLLFYAFLPLSVLNL